jgi:hypothetical protein
MCRLHSAAILRIFPTSRGEILPISSGLFDERGNGGMRLLFMIEPLSGCLF